MPEIISRKERPHIQWNFQKWCRFSVYSLTLLLAVSYCLSSAKENSARGADFEKSTKPMANESEAKIALIKKLSASIEKAASAATLVKRGNTYLSLSRFSEAERDYQKAIELEPSYPLSYINRATLRMLQGKPGEALNDYNVGFSKDKNFSWLKCRCSHPILGRAKCYLALGDCEKALADVKTCLRFQADNSEAQELRTQLETLSSRSAKKFLSARLAH